MQRKPDRLSAPCSTASEEVGSSRRHFISQLAALSAGLSVVTPISRGVSETTQPAPGPDQSPEESALVDITLRINGTGRKLRVDPRVDRRLPQGLRRAGRTQPGVSGPV